MTNRKRNEEKLKCLGLTPDTSDQGSFKDVSFIWATCTNPSTGTGYPLQSGRLPACDGAASCSLTLPKKWSPQVTSVTIRYLSCENGNWVKKKKKAGMQYNWNGKTWDLTN